MTESLDVPDEFDADSYRAGYAEAMRQIGHAALDGASGLDPEDSEPGDAPDVCSNCGADATRSITDGASAYTGEGYRCVGCEG